MNIQNSHTISSVGYQQPLIRTEYEYLVPYKTGKLFCYTAEDDGVVTAKTDSNITLKFKNNEVKSINIGRIFGDAEGTTFPHDVISILEVGNKFKKGDYISYNTNFFEQDWLDKSKLILKFGRLTTVALTMTNEVFEDSCTISSELSRELNTNITKVRTFVIDFSKNIVNLKEEGEELDPNDIMFILTDEHTDYANLSESSLVLLQGLANLAPKAKIKGIVDRYEIRYNGDIADMSPTLKKLTNRLDRELHERTKGTEYEVPSGKVSREYRSEGKNLQIDTLEFKVYITVNLTASVGDKGVFANQMKTVISDVFTNQLVTESGTKVDALFSYKGIASRVVLSPIMIGTTNRLLKHLSKQVADIYFK